LCIGTTRNVEMLTWAKSDYFKHSVQLCICARVSVCLGPAGTHLKGSVKEPNISICFFFFRPSLNGVLFSMFCLLVEEECQILVF